MKAKGLTGVEGLEVGTLDGEILTFQTEPGKRYGLTFTTESEAEQGNISCKKKGKGAVYPAGRQVPFGNIRRKNMKNLRSRLEAELAEKKILIMAHRGVCGANIIENTMEAFELALRQGGGYSGDGRFPDDGRGAFIFHDGTEGYMLGKKLQRERNDGGRSAGAAAHQQDGKPAGAWNRNTGRCAGAV